MSENDTFSAVDYAVFAITIGITVVVGIVASFLGVKEKNVAQYFVGNRRLAVLPVAISMLMSRVSGNDMLGTTAEMYFFGTQAAMETLGRLLAYPIPIFLIVPLIYPLKLTSILEVA